MLRSNAPILQKTAKRNIVRHPAKLSNILVITQRQPEEWVETVSAKKANVLRHVNFFEWSLKSLEFLLKIIEV